MTLHVSVNTGCGLHGVHCTDVHYYKHRDMDVSSKFQNFKTIMDVHVQERYPIMSPKPWQPL